MSVLKRFQGKRLKSAKDPNWNKGTWYVWKRVNGKIIHKALKDAKTKEQAEAAERKIIERAFNQRYGLADTVTTFAQFADGSYTKYVRQQNVNIVTKLQYIGLLKAFFKGQVLTTITPQDCRDCQTAMKKKGYAASTVNGIMSTLSKIFTIAGQERIVDYNPMQFVKKLEEPPPRDRLLTTEERESLWRELDKDELMSALVRLAVNLPLRRGQLLAITPAAVDLSNGWLLAGSSKGRKSRLVPLNNIAANTLTLMIERGQLPFPLKETGIQKRLKKALKAAGIENFRFHDLRKEFASNLRRKGAHSKTIQDLFAHSSMRMTDVYLPPEFEMMREAVNSLDEIQQTEGIQ